MIKSDSNSYTMFFEDGKEVFPCRCGKTHRGDYGAYDRGHHECFHDDELVSTMLERDPIQAICVACGKSWKVSPITLPTK